MTDTPIQNKTQTIEQNPIQSNHPDNAQSHPAIRPDSKDAANVSLPSLFDFQRTPGSPGSDPPEPVGPSGEAPSSPPLTHVSTRLRQTPQVFSNAHNSLKSQGSKPLNQLDEPEQGSHAFNARCRNTARSTSRTASKPAPESFPPYRPGTAPRRCS